MASKRSKNWFWFSLIAIICVSLTNSFSLAQTDEYDRWINGVTEPWFFDPAPMTKAEIAEAQSRWKLIESETQGAASDEWAGVYFTGGETHGSYLRWSSQAGFVLFDVDKCRATVMNLDYGKVSASASLMQFFPELNKKTAGHGHAHASSMPLRFIPVRWDGNRYLVTENAIADFGDYVAGLGKYNRSENQYGIDGLEFFIRLDAEDEVSKAQFLPIMPAGYERFIRNPIDAIITGIGKGYVRRDSENDWWDNLVLPVTVNVGKADGVKSGMSLILVKSERGETIEIRKVGLRTASGVIIRSTRKVPCVKIERTDDCKDPDYEPITVGRRASTSSFRK